MTGAETMGGPVAIKLGIAIIERLAPSGVAMVKSWFKGKDIVIVGQPRAGKTTFVDYFHYGLFEHEKDTAKTSEDVRTPRFNIKIGRSSALELYVRTAIDIPGQWGAVKHADVAFDRNPHALVILIDVTAPTKRGEGASAKWLTEFCTRLETRWRANRGRSNRLKSMLVLLNKSDKANRARLDACKDLLSSVIEARLHDAKGRMSDDIAIMPCCLVINSAGTGLVDSAIAHLAKALVR